MIEHAERFGLSQLHQLRGRVGRGAHQSHCVLLYQYPISKQGKARLQALADTTNGFEIAERDLELRGAWRFLRHAAVRTADTPDRRSAARSSADGTVRVTKPHCSSIEQAAHRTACRTDESGLAEAGSG